MPVYMHGKMKSFFWGGGINGENMDEKELPV